MAAPGPAPAPQRVNIILTKSVDQNSIIVAPGKFHIHTNPNNGPVQVEWNCTASGFSIDFVGDCPFDQSHFERPDPGPILSGVAKTLGDDFKYTVTVGGNVLDPSGKVDP